jgi:hypothetical protein
MARNRNRKRDVAAPSPFEQARDEMFQHIIRCGVLQASPEHQKEWFDQTIHYLGDRYHELGEPEVAELRTLGERFCQPPKAKAEPAEAPTEEADAA